MVIIPSVFKSFDLLAAQSTRQGGFSRAPFDSLNLSLSVGDEEPVVQRNRETLCQYLGISVSQLALSRQVHGNQVLQTSEPLQTEGYDAIITATPGVYACVSVADCTPVLVYDPVQGVSAAIHAGWKGTVAYIVRKTLEAMQQGYGSNPADCVAWIGACISKESFEVGDDVAAYFEDAEKRYEPGIRKYFVDLKEANRRQLLEAGLKAENIGVSPYCTVKDNDRFFSYRAGKGQTGRMWAIIGRPA
ncbi:MAG: peptidoglycan editing factor PgeF [Bacteroidetes bacterium]|nr:peptidoglycan editing factor PgeF [Bacteroidota bacterium]